MGGMIGQMLAAEHPELRPLPDLDHVDDGQPLARASPPSPSIRYLLRPPPRDRDGYIERSAEVFGLVGSTGLRPRRAVHP